MIGEGQATAADGWVEAFRSAMGNDPPDILFWVTLDGHEMVARPPGALIYCRAIDVGMTDVRIFANTDPAGQLLHVRVMRACSEADITNESTAIASALYWSHWRHLVLVGKRPQDVDQTTNPNPETYHPTPHWRSARPT